MKNIVELMSIYLEHYLSLVTCRFFKDKLNFQMSGITANKILIHFTSPYGERMGKQADSVLCHDIYILR